LKGVLFALPLRYLSAATRNPFLTDEPLHIAPTHREARAQTSSFVVHPSPLGEQKPTNGEADTPIIGRNLEGRYANVRPSKMNTDRPHIPSSDINVNERGTQATLCAILPAQQAARAPDF
jgi:hypothetical protein